MPDKEKLMNVHNAQEREIGYFTPQMERGIETPMKIQEMKMSFSQTI